MDRAKAKSMTRTVQTVAVVLVAAAAAAALVPLTVKAEVEVAPPPPPPKKVEAPKLDIDTALVTMALNSISGPVKNQPPEKTEDAPPTPPPLVGIEAWRYLGGILSTSYKRAIVVINDQQHLFAEGQKYNPDAAHNPDGGVEIVQIDKAFIKVKQGEVEHTINLAPRQRPALTVIEPGAGRNGAANQANGNAPGARPVNNPAAASLSSRNRQRDLERAKADAKARGDDKAAEMYDQELNSVAGKEGKLEKGEKGQK